MDTRGAYLAPPMAEDMFAQELPPGFVDMQHEPTVVYRSLVTARKPLQG